MGHDITGHNKAGEIIAYARFSMGNSNSTILYSLLDANEFHAGVSGSGNSSTLSVQQMEKALNNFNRIYERWDSMDSKQISEFLQNCYSVANKEGSVKVSFA